MFIQGEGELLEEVVVLYKFLFFKKVLKLDGIVFVVFGFGDIFYEFFCQFGKDFDNKLVEFGVECLFDCVDVDVEYQVVVVEWCVCVVEVLKVCVLVVVFVQLVISGVVNDIYISLYIKEVFLMVILLVNQKIIGCNLEKDVCYIEIDFGDFGLCYQLGDVLGVWYQNDFQLVKELVELLWLKGDELVIVEGKILLLLEVLQWYFELMVNIVIIVENYVILMCSELLLLLVGDKVQLQQYVVVMLIVDMVCFFLVQLDVEVLIGLLCLLMLCLYFIVFLQVEVESEVYVIVGVVCYEIEGCVWVGGVFSFFVDCVEEDGEVCVFIEYNDNFCLLVNLEILVIMIGLGIGIVLFCVFMQQCVVDGV